VRPSIGICGSTTVSARIFVLVERELARDALGNPKAKRLMTIPGIDMVVAVGVLAAIGMGRPPNASSAFSWARIICIS
jgi:Transposase IS116/IS110/IS902 family